MCYVSPLTPRHRVGHVYRKYAPFPNPGVGDYLGRNYKRVAEVWMDEFSEFVYKRRPHYRHLDAGDITEQKALRDKLKCKPFKWFMEEIAPDLVQVYPPVEPPEFGSGRIRSVFSPSLCLDSGYKQHGDDVGVAECGSSGEQEFHLTWHRDIRPGRRSVCLDVSSNEVRAPVALYTCHGMGGNQLWQYVTHGQQLRHGANTRCLTVDHQQAAVYVATCEEENLKQQWTVDHLDEQRLKEWHR